MSSLRQLSILCLSLLFLTSCNEKSESASSTPATDNPCLDILNKQLNATNSAAQFFNAGEASINQWLIAYATPDHSQLKTLLTDIEDSLGLGTVSGAVAFGFATDTLEICSKQAVDSDKVKGISTKVVAAKKAKEKAVAAKASAPSDACSTLVGNLSTQANAASTSLATLQASLKNAIGVASDPAKVKAAAEVVFIDSTISLEKLGSLANFVDANKPELATCSTVSAKAASK